MIAWAGGRDLVSVVIPTRGRASLVGRAVRSALAQDYARLEVVVVVDGHDDDTRAALDAIDDARLRVVTLPEARGGCGARNAGVAAAMGAWVAFLDDDDEWLEQKLSMQMRLAASSPCARPVICSRTIARSPRGDEVWPVRLPAPDEPLSEYLFARRGLFQGEGLVQSSTVLAPRDLLLRLPFTDGLPVHQDWDWLLRAARAPGAQLSFVPEPLAIWHIEEERAGISRQSRWEESLNWIESVRGTITPRAYAAFLLLSVSARAARAHAWRAFLRIPWRAVRFGSPRPIDFIIFFGIWLIPQPLRWRLRAALHGRPHR